MPEISYDSDSLRYLSLFEHITHARVKDCIVLEDRLIFIIEKGEILKAVGKKGEHVMKLKEIVKKNIQIIEYNEDPLIFVKNVFYHYGVESVEVEMRGNIKHASVKVKPEMKGKAIGKEGRNLKVFRDIINRYFDIQSVSVV
ncbi:MAG: NusA-like transcription termination signal-binding factor [Thermoplasmata archaeon]